MTKIADQNRVNRTAAFIAKELRSLLDRHDIHSFISQCLQRSPDFHAGETLMEEKLATLKALNAVASDVVADIADGHFDPDPELDDELIDLDRLRERLRHEDTGGLTAEVPGSD